MKMTTEEAFVKVLQMHGIEHAFGIIGSAALVGLIELSLALIALKFLRETFGKSLQFIEGDGESQPDRKPSEKASNGAPVTFVVDKLNPNGLDVSVYNFSDKTYGAYGLMIRYLDASGNPLKAKMSFKADFMTWSISGKSYRVPPKEWRSFSLDRLETPAGAVKAEIAVSSVNATDGIKIDQDFAFRVSDFEWPGAKAAR